MRKQNACLAVAGLVGLSTTLACALTGTGALPNAQHTQIAVTIYVMQTEISASRTAAAVTLVPSPAAATATATETLPGPTLAPAQNPLVIQDSLCWLGPGAPYEVSSTVHAGTRVELLGQGSLPGWWVIRNPIYGDPCWMPMQDLQIDLSYSLYGLPVFYPPATATPTRMPKPTRTPSATPT